MKKALITSILALSISATFASQPDQCAIRAAKLATAVIQINELGTGTHAVAEIETTKTSKAGVIDSTYTVSFPEITYEVHTRYVPGPDASCFLTGFNPKASD